MHPLIESFFADEKIEYYSALAYSNARVLRKDIAERAGIEPKSVIIMLVPYYFKQTLNLSVYAASKDYHIYLKGLTSRLSALMKNIYPNNNFVGFGDHSPIDERHAAAVCGLGMLGENGLLINEKYGTYVFVAELVSDVEPSELSATEPREIKRCTGCKRCSKLCPRLNGESERCLSEITQRKGELSECEKALMRKYNTAWGCDLCQKECPHNVGVSVTPIEFFKSELIPELTLDALNEMSKDEFSQRAFSWRGRKTVERNLKILSE